MNWKKYGMCLLACVALQACGNKTSADVVNEIEKIDLDREAVDVKKAAEEAEKDSKKLEKLKTQAVDKDFEATKCLLDSSGLEKDAATKNSSITEGCSALEISAMKWKNSLLKDKICSLKKGEDLAAVQKAFDKLFTEAAEKIELDLENTTCKDLQSESAE